MKKITQVAQMLLCDLQKRKTAIDFTCGNGFDTFALAHHFDKVYAFDIQEVAIENTKEKCRFLQNVEYHLDSHEHFDKYVKCFDAGIFNLGYLPQADNTITTDADVVIRTLEKALTYLKSDGMLVLVMYPGFEHGKQEALRVEEYCSLLQSKYFDVSKTMLVNRVDAPYIIRIDKHNI